MTCPVPLEHHHLFIVDRIEKISTRSCGSLAGSSPKIVPSHSHTRAAVNYSFQEGAQPFSALPHSRSHHHIRRTAFLRHLFIATLFSPSSSHSFLALSQRAHLQPSFCPSPTTHESDRTLLLLFSPRPPKFIFRTAGAEDKA